MSIKLPRSINILIVGTLFLLTATACGGVAPAAPAATAEPTTAVAPIVGMWKGYYQNEDVSMTFDAAGNVSIAVYGGLQAGTYTVNYDSMPYQLDLKMEGDVTILTIAEFVDQNTLKIENIYPGEDRPAKFSDFFLLTRQD